MTTEKRNFSSLSFSSKRHGTESPNSHLPTKLKNFFRINNPGSSTALGVDGLPAPKSELKSGMRQTRFLPSLGRNRSTTVASDGDPLSEALSPTAHANPYFAHQGPPVLRHHNEGSVPPSPPDTPKVQINGNKDTGESAITAGKEELARKLRRVASAPNVQGLFSSSKGGEERPKTAQLGKEPVIVQQEPPRLSMVAQDDLNLVPDIKPGAKLPLPGQLRQSIAFRRTYSSNSIKVRNVEVGPSSFDKIKLIGKGDVGKVYLVREKKSNRLYAMKGKGIIRRASVVIANRTQSLARKK
jgi:protein-serine/threonine kinase